MTFIYTVPIHNREYLAPKLRSMNNLFHSDAKLPSSYDYPLTNDIATNQSSTNHEMPLFSRLYSSLGYLRKIFLPRSLKYSLLMCTINSINLFGDKKGISICCVFLRILVASQVFLRWKTPDKSASLNSLTTLTLEKASSGSTVTLKRWLSPRILCPWCRTCI